jgi:uncharacterized protein YbjT (DUF2867 family)
VRVAVTRPTGKLGRRVVARLAAAGVEQAEIAAAGPERPLVFVIQAYNSL